MIDPTISAAATSTLEKLINKALQYDPSTRLRLEALDGQSLAIEFTELKLELCVFFDEDGLMISNQSIEPTTQLRGTLPGFIQLARSNRVNLAESRVEAWGDTELLAEVKAIADDLEIDWEEAINQWLGDVTGHQFANGIRKQLDWLKGRGETGRRLLSEFLTEEFRASPSDSEVRQFNDNVDELRLATDRLQARFQRLQQAKTDQNPTT